VVGIRREVRILDAWVSLYSSKTQQMWARAA